VEFLKSFSLHVILIIDVIMVSFENPARIPDVASREIWSPRWSSDGFSKGPDQIGFTMFVQRLANFMTGLFPFIHGVAFSLFGGRNQMAVGSNPPVGSRFQDWLEKRK
jgi:hypothetical protein